jgi:hypothetical protein
MANDDCPVSLSGSNEKKLVPKIVCPISRVSCRRIYNSQQKDTVKLTEIKVAGKKVIVTTAIAFIADASLFASSPICSCTLLSLCAAALKAWFHRLR